MRSTVVFVVGVLAVVAAPAGAHAWWVHYPHARLHHPPRVGSPLASPLYFQLPFGFGVNVSGLQVQGPLGNRVEIGDQGRQTPVTIDDSTKRDIRELKTDLSDLLKKTNRLSQKMNDPNTKKPFEDLKEGAGPTTSGGPLGGSKDKDKGGKATPPGDD